MTKGFDLGSFANFITTNASSNSINIGGELIVNNSTILVNGSITANGSVGTAGQFLTTNTTGVYWSLPSPPGSNTQITFNDSGFANASAGLTFNKTSNTLAVGGDTTVNSTALSTLNSNLMIAAATSGRVVNFYSGGTTTPTAVVNSTCFSLTSNICMILSHNDLETLPSANSLRIIAKSNAGRYFPGWYGPSGLDTLPQPFIGRNRIRYLAPEGLNTTTAPAAFPGTSLLANNLAVTARAYATTSIVTRAARVGYVTGSTAGSIAWLRHSVAYCTTGSGAGNGAGGFHFINRFSVTDTTQAARMFVGLTSNLSAPTNVEPSTLTNTIGLAKLTGDFSQWYIVYGGSAAQSAIALGATVGAPNDTSALWEFSMFSSPNQNGVVGYQLTNLATNVYVRGTLTPGTPGTQTPASTTGLVYQIWRTNNATAATVAFDFVSLYLETDD